MMLLSKLGIAILLIFFLVSCVEDTPVQCSNDFMSSYKKMGDDFTSLYKPLAGLEEKQKLQSSLSSFLEQHRGVECEYQGNTIAPSGEVESFMSSLKKDSQVLSTPKFTSKVIYGVDNRQDVEDSPSLKYREWARSTFAQMEPRKISEEGSIISSTLSESFGLCSSERFSDQKNPARCSGFLVGPDTLVTAGHCVTSQSECESTVWVADFTSDVTKIESTSVFGCKELIQSELSNETLLDYAVIKLDRKVDGRKYFRIQSEKRVESSTELVVIGHPSGLPTKIADGGRVRSNSNEYFFSAALDTYGGNSGSAVINAQSGVVEGILVRGETDYEWSTDSSSGERCRISKVCDEDKCRGEDVTRMSQVKGIPILFSEKSLIEDIFESKSAPDMDKGWVSILQGIEKSGHIIAGKKFIDRCGLHVAQVGMEKSWESYFSGPCVENSRFEEIASDFIQKFYF